MRRVSFAEISLANLRSNVAVLKSRVDPTAFFCPMVKANAYGHGDIEVANALEECGVSAVGVGLVEEAERLRRSGFSGRVVCFGVFGGEAIEALSQLGCEVVLSGSEEVGIACRHPGWFDSRGAGIHLKFNTGMNRLGLAAEEAQKTAESIERAGLRSRVVGVCTHLHTAEDLLEVNSSARMQEERFRSIRSAFEGWSLQSHLDNSAALARRSGRGESLGARPGIAVYGIGAGLAPVLSLHSSIVQTQSVKAGEVVSYAGMYRTAQDTTIGVVPIGYADGWTRRLSGKGEVLIGGARRRIVGAICMDYCMVDLGPSPKFGVGERVTLIGTQGSESITVDEIAVKTNTIPYEILTSVSERVRRVYTR